MDQSLRTAAVIPPSRRVGRKQHAAVIWLPLLALALVIGASRVARFADDSVDPLELHAPALPTVGKRCQAPIEVYSRRAIELERVGLDKVARYPFAPAEGLRAVGLLTEAESCALAAKEQAVAARLRARAEAFRRRLERDYRDRLTRYRRARASARHAQALADVLFLLELLRAHDGPFPAQLRRVRLELEENLQRKERS
jgi:hypothetical protein